MDEKPFWQELIEREKNFYGNNDPLAMHSKLFYVELQGLSESIEVDIDKLRGLGKEQTLKMIFSRVYNFVIFNNDDFSIFDKNMVIYDDTFNACLFTLLCMFLHSTKRIKASTISDYIFNYSPSKYHIKGESKYVDLKYTTKNSPKRNLINADETAMRQYRHRLFKQKSVYTRSTEWSAIPETSKHEWILYFDYITTPDNEGADSNERETLKRIKNLYNGLDDALNSPMDTQYVSRLEDYFDKLWARVEKIKYKDYLKLCKSFLTHIDKNIDYYGINIYRFEKELCLYRITNDVRRLLECKNESEEAAFLDRCIAASGICFPRLYNYFWNFNDLQDIKFYTQTFLLFMNDVVQTGRLILDKFVEDGYLGRNWKTLFLNTINGLVDSVFYDPKKIDYTVESRSQEMFINSILAPVNTRIYEKIKIYHYNTFSSLESDDKI